MYECRNRSGLGFSLKPPEWLRAIGQQIIGGVSVNVPTPVGPVSLSPGQVAAAARGTTVTYKPPSQPPTLAEQVERSVPGGFGTLGALAVGGLVLMLLLRRR